MQEEPNEQSKLQAFSITNQVPPSIFSNLSSPLESSPTRGLDQFTTTPYCTNTSNTLHKFVSSYNSNKTCDHTIHLSQEFDNLNNINHDSDNNTTSSSMLRDVEQQQQQQERRARRLVSNRESARRSRMRKRRQLEELQNQVLCLLATNHHLSEKLNHVLECNYRLLQENASLKQDIANCFFIDDNEEDFHSQFHSPAGQRFSGRLC